MVTEWACYLGNIWRPALSLICFKLQSAQDESIHILNVAIKTDSDIEDDALAAMFKQFTQSKVSTALYWEGKGEGVLCSRRKFLLRCMVPVKTLWIKLNYKLNVHIVLYPFQFALYSFIQCLKLNVKSLYIKQVETSRVISWWVSVCRTYAWTLCIEMYLYWMWACNPLWMTSISFCTCGCMFVPFIF